MPDLDAARAEAVRSVRSVLCADLRDGRIDLRGRIDVANAAGEILATISFPEAVELVQEGRQQ